MKTSELASIVDHTLLKQSATLADIYELCDEAVAWQTASVCIPPCYVASAFEYLRGRIPLCTVIGFPNGNSTVASKVFEAREALQCGAEELDMVINIGMLKAGENGYVLDEIRQLKDVTGNMVLKVIVETSLLTEGEKVRACELVSLSGADYIKTSTGFAGGGATFDDVKLFANNVDPRVKIKASGGITSLTDAMTFVSLGASRLGTSRVVKLLMKQSAAIGDY